MTVLGLVLSTPVAVEDHLDKIINERRLHEPVVVAVVVVSLLVLIGVVVWWALRIEGRRRDTSRRGTSGEQIKKSPTPDPDRWWNAG
ncbi:MAG: hypothetical protein GWP04_10155 [Gammaproteobacteria bacterium]|nr:hypothetical protein [Gammaproteobacteria bacterium]